MVEKSQPTHMIGERCLVVVPCYNEARRLRTDEFLRFIERERSVELLFVNDGSRDSTLEVLRELEARCPERIHVFDKQPNGGKAEAVRVGMLHATRSEGVTVTGFWDADLATPLSVIPEMLAKLKEKPGTEMIFGSRVRLLGHAIHRKPLRHYLGRCFATAVSLMLHMPVYDTQCGAKLFRVTPDFCRIVEPPFQTRWIFDVEIIARFIALRRGDPHFAALGIYENPLPEWEDVAGSKLSPLDFVAAAGDLWRIRLVRKRWARTAQEETRG